MNLNQVTLPVHDISAAKVFYQTLGFELIVDTDHYLRFACPDGGVTFSLGLSDATPSSGTGVYFEHRELDEWVKSLQQKGIVFEQLPTDQRYLWREAIVKDPSGNKIVLYYAGENRLNPPWRVNSDSQKDSQ